ncbi:MAG: STAS domain-containing protein [Gammaproteobacteria bacterium]
MSVKQNISDDGKIMHLSITGRFDYKITKEFRDSYTRAARHKGVTYYINLNNASYIDSSALGILLLLRECAKHNDGRVIIEQPSEQVSQVLKVANFERLFTINQTRSKPDLVVVKTKR